MSRKKDLLILDLDKKYDVTSDIIYWNSYDCIESDRVFSIPKLVEDNADLLKAKYLSLIYDFGEAQVNGKRITEHLIIRQNFSYWWLTLFAEKCNIIKSPQIDNIIKLMVLEKFLIEGDYQKVKFVSTNDELAMSVSQLTIKLLIDFDWEKVKSKKPKRGLIKNIFHFLPNLIKSPAWLVFYLFSNWSLKGEGVEEWSKTNATSTFVSYFFNLVPEAIKEGRYESYYWTKLNNILNDNQHSTNWLHIYVKDNLLPTSKDARDLIRRFNASPKNNQVHTTLASFLSWRLIFLTLKDWFKILRLYKLVRKQLKVTSGHFWPLFEKDCQDSMSGISALSNLLDFNLFEKAMRALPPQDRGCYLQENMGWEFGFISAWQSAGHQNNLIGFPAGGVSYWDLRNFFDPRSYQRQNHCDLPLPNYVGINGEVAKNIYLKGGYPQQDLIEVESLRYLYLSNSSLKRDKLISKEKVILVIGDYLKQNTYNQLILLSSAHEDVALSVRYIIKPHPLGPVSIENFSNLPIELSTKPIQELLEKSDMVFTGPLTTAGIDAYCLGLPIITHLNGKTLNMSPLRGVKSVYFATNSDDLSIAINTLVSTNLNLNENYFYLNPTLPKWNKWLMDDFNKKE